MIELKGKNAFITGSSRGVGQQVAMGLAKLGCNIIVHGRSKDSCTKTLELLKDYAVKLKDTGVRINTLDPGWLRTDLGGENADHPVEAVLPGALAPALVEDDGPNGKFFSAIDHKLDI